MNTNSRYRNCGIILDKPYLFIGFHGRASWGWFFIRQYKGNPHSFVFFGLEISFPKWEVK